MSKSYHEQFRDNQRNQNGLFLNSKATAGGKLPPHRPAAVAKQPPRSNTFTLPTKREVTYIKVPKTNQAPNDYRRQPPRELPVLNLPPPAERRSTETMRKNVSTRPMLKQPNSIIDRQNIERKPVRFANNYNNTYYSPSPTTSAPVHHQKSPSYANSLPRDALDQSRRTRISNDEYIIRRRKDPSASDYHTVSDIPTISFGPPLPPITPPTNQTGPTVIIHSKETVHPDTPTIYRSISAAPSYYQPPPPAPYMILPQSGISSYPPNSMFLPSPGISSYPPNSMFLPSSGIPSCPQNSTMYLPSSGIPSYPPNSTMFLPTSGIPSYPSSSGMMMPSTTAPIQLSDQTFLLQPPPTSTYVSQPFFYSMPYSNPNPFFSVPPPPPPPPPPHQTIISQSSSSSVSVPQPLKIEDTTGERNATIIVRPNTTNNNKKNVTIQVKVIDEENSYDRARPQRQVRVVNDSPYRDDDNVYYVDSEPKRLIYEQPRRRTAIVRRPPENEYVYVNEPPPPVVRHRSHRPEGVYFNDDRSLEYEEQIIYVDDYGNEIDYAYDDEPVYRRRSNKKSRYPSSTNIIYE